MVFYTNLKGALCVFYTINYKSQTLFFTVDCFPKSAVV